MQSRNIFITGATGFIGKKLALELAEKNHVFALVRPESAEKTQELKQKGVNIIYGDLLDSESFFKKINNIDYVFHLAALFKLDASKEDLYNCNVLGTKKLLESCIDKNIKKFIYFSTAYVVGIKEKDFIPEDEPYPDRFKNLYEWSKAESEKLVLRFCKDYRLPIIILRPAIVYGPDSHYGFASILSLISKNKMWVFPGSGRNKVHLVNIEDVINAAIYLAESDASDKIYNICDNLGYTSRQIVDFLCKKLSRNKPLLRIPGCLAKFASRTVLWNLFFKDMPSQLLDYFLYNQTYSNKKLISTGYVLNYPDALKGLESLIGEHKYVLS